MRSFRPILPVPVGTVRNINGVMIIPLKYSHINVMKIKHVKMENIY